MYEDSTLKSRGAMSVSEFARWAGIGRTTAWREIHYGELRAIKANARTLVTVDDARRWLNSRPTTAESSSRTGAGRRAAYQRASDV